MPGEIRARFGITRFNGRVVRAFPFENHATKAPIAHLYGSSAKIGQLFSAAQQKFAEIDASQDYTVSGRKAAKREWAKANAGALKEAIAAINAADAEIKQTRSKMTPQALDSTDIVGAMRRQEIRAYLRGLPDAKRAAMFLEGPTWSVDPEIALAVTEAPAALSGVSDDAKNRLLERSHGVRYPEELAQIENISAASEAVSDMVGVTADALRSNGLSDDDLAQVMGTPTYADRLGAIIAGIAPSADNEAA